MDVKCRWRSDQLDGAVRFWEHLGQTKVMRIHQRETLNHQGAITHEVCSLAAQLILTIFVLMVFYCVTFGAQVLARKFWRASFGAQVLARKFWRENFGAKIS